MVWSMPWRIASSTRPITSGSSRCVHSWTLWHVVVLYLFGHGSGRLGGALERLSRRLLEGRLSCRPLGQATFLSPIGTGDFLVAHWDRRFSCRLLFSIAKRFGSGRSVEWGLRPPDPPWSAARKPPLPLGGKKAAAPARRQESRRSRSATRKSPVPGRQFKHGRHLFP